MTDQAPDDKTKLFNRLDKIDKDMEEIKSFITMFSEIVKSEEKKEPDPKAKDSKKESSKEKSFLDELFAPYEN